MPARRKDVHTSRVSPVAVFALAAAACTAVVIPPHASAHLGNLSYSDIKISGAHLAYSFRFAAHLVPGIEANGRGEVQRRAVIDAEASILEWLSATIRIQSGRQACTPEIDELIGPDTRDDLTVVLGYTCPLEINGLRVEFRPFDRNLTGYKNIATISRGEERWTHVFDPSRPVVMLGGQTSADTVASNLGSEAQQASAGGFVSFFRLGIDHILGGYDHLLFLLALLLAPGLAFGQAAAIVTAFTIAHSITLASAALDVFSLPQRPVEIVIAVSILYVAGENVLRRHISHRWLVTFLFGLVHGFGFAGILREIGLPPGNVVLPLLGFNLGVEVGQVTTVVIALPLLAAVGRFAGHRRVRLALSLAIIVMGTIWLVQRV